jgi:hypothetical protein
MQITLQKKSYRWKLYMPWKPPKGLALKRSDRKTEKELPNASYYNILHMRTALK